MHINAVTVGIPVGNLDDACNWYQKAFELGPPDLAPMDGMVEFNLGVFWLQIFASNAVGTAGISLNISVPDASAERHRLADLGLKVSDLDRIEGVVEYFELIDPDGNRIGFITELNGQN